MALAMRQSVAVATILARLGLGSSFLSAVADRLGLWGVYGSPHVAWGDFARFTAYTAKLNSFLPASCIPALAWTATYVEVALGIALLLGLFTRLTAFASGILLLLFGFSMAVALGVKSPLDASVFSASAAAFLLAATEKYPVSIDSLKAALHS